MIDFVGKRFWFFLVSGVAVLIGIVSLAVVGLKPGIDFASGTTFTIRAQGSVDQAQLRQALAGVGIDRATIQRSSTGDFFVRTREISSAEKANLDASLQKALGQVSVLDFSTVSAVIASETARDAGIAIVVAAFFILFYIAWAFRKLPKPWRWGVCATVPLVHDCFWVLTVFSIFGHVANLEVDSLFVTGILAIVGYSINNTIVVFDRIRDNMLHNPVTDFGVTVNNSILETVARSLNTSLTTLFVVIALYLFGGATIHNFMLVLLIGIVVGTYSASCIAPQLLVVWDRRDWGLPRGTPRGGTGLPPSGTVPENARRARIQQSGG